MPTYQFGCDDCGLVTETICSWSQRPATLSCSCGGSAEPMLGVGSVAIVKGKQYETQTDPTKPGCAPMPVSWRAGVDGPTQQRMNDRVVRKYKKRIAESKRSLSRKKGPRQKAAIPRELFQARINQFGHRYWADGGDDALRRDNLI